MSNKRVFLDNASTTPISPEIIDMMSEMMKSHFANPSSVHSYGRESKIVVEGARKKIAELLNTSPGSIFFDLGSSYIINSIAFWNQSSGSAQTTEYALYVNDSYTVRGSGIKIGHFYPETNFDHFIGAVADIESFADIESQFFEIELIENLNCPTGCTGFNEILFASPIPVPAAAWLFGSALVGLGLVRRR